MQQIQEIIEQQQKDISDLTVVIDRVSAVLLNAIEFHDPYTKGHGDRVSIILQKLTQKMYPDLFTDKGELKLAAQLHDIGKLGVNEMVLNKPSFLTEAEKYMLWAHPNWEQNCLNLSCFHPIIYSIRVSSIIMKILMVLAIPRA
jgi:HD-GYP domain-containing protein (c-di-GMP phosphodiesterase class II)